MLLGEPLDGAGKPFYVMRRFDPARSVTWPAFSPEKCFHVWRERRAHGGQQADDHARNRRVDASSVHACPSYERRRDVGQLGAHTQALHQHDSEEAAERHR